MELHNFPFIKSDLIFRRTLSANAQRITTSKVQKKTTFTPSTGDSEIDRHLQKINKFGLAEFSSFKRELASKFNISSREISRIYPKDKIEPGDIFKPGEDLGSLLAKPGDAFYAYTLSSFTGKPVSGIIDLFTKKQNWQEVTAELGIKPGSKNFNELKGIALNSIGKVKGKN